MELDAGENEGQLEVVDLDCSGPLTLTSATATALTFDSVIDDNSGGCEPRGTLTLVLNGSDQLAYQWVSAVNPTVKSVAVLQRD